MILAVLAVLLLIQAPPEGVAFDRDVVYGTGGGEELKLNMARPEKPDGRVPCVLIIHGGGWAGGSREAHDDITWKFAARGTAAATVGYRLAPKHPFPAAVEDVKCAVRFLRANAEKYGIDPDRIGAVGFSAGGHLAMMLGVMGPGDGLEGDGGCADQSSQVNAVVSFFGPTDLAADDLPEESRKIVATFVEKPEDRAKASPLTYISKGDPQMLLFQGTKDPLVPHTQATKMADAMTAAGVRGRVQILVGATHGWIGSDLERTADETFDFFDARLKRRTAPKKEE